MGLYQCETKDSLKGSFAVIVKTLENSDLVCKILADEDLIDIAINWSNNERTSFYANNAQFTKIMHLQHASFESLNDLVENTYQAGTERREKNGSIIGSTISLIKDKNDDCYALMSRTLISILKGAPHSIPYGIVEVINQEGGNEIFMIEETIDTQSVFLLCQQAWEATQECRIGMFSSVCLT
jgi:hypothetical protein